MEEDSISWYHLPFYRALTEHILFMGVPFRVLIANGLISFIFIFEFHFFYILLLTVVIHFLGVYLARGDAQFFDCWLRYSRHRDYYTI